MARIAVVAALLAVLGTTAALVTGSDSGSKPTNISAQPPPPRSNHHFWLVKSGQTLSQIVSRTGVSAATIRSLNPHQDLSLLRSGQQVRVRPTLQQFWLVHSGQTLSEIATRTKVSQSVIRGLNPHQDLSILRSGQKVRVRP